MSQSLRIEAPELCSLITTRTRNSELWFVNQPKFEQKVLGYLAKYQETYRAELYAFTFQGNHDHNVARFPNQNRAHFMRDFNSISARLANAMIPGRPAQGSLWGRRYGEEKLPNKEDVEKYFWYCVFQPVQAGLCENPFHYPGYNFFHDAISGKERCFKVFDRAGYNDRKRWDRKIRRKDFIKTFTLKYTRLPGYEHLTQADYKALMLKKFKERLQALIAERKAKGLGFLGRRALLAQTPGSLPQHTKTSTRTSHRPFVLTMCKETRKRILSWYFGIREAYRYASERFRRGARDVVFPPYTYKPPTYAGAG